MFYKLVKGDIVIDILKKIQYVRYLSKSKRWVITDAQSAHGVMCSDQNTVYLLEDRFCPCEGSFTKINIEEITEEEYIRLANEIALRAKENEELRNEISSLKEQLQNQNELLLQILSKL